MLFIILIIIRIMKSSTSSKKKVTLSLDAAVYDGIRRKVGQRSVGAFLSQLARPHVLANDLEASYLAQAKDAKNASEANEWLNGTEEVVDAENVWQL